MPHPQNVNYSDVDVPYSDWLRMKFVGEKENWSRSHHFENDSRVDILSSHLRNVTDEASIIACRAKGNK